MSQNGCLRSGACLSIHTSPRNRRAGPRVAVLIFFACALLVHEDKLL